MNKERRHTVWSRQRIGQLIELYKKHECLWNPWNDFYKNKAKRNKALETICSTLEVSKPEFAKKIHNLRNQFNTEVKKYEQLLQEAEEEDGNKSNNYRCRWVHFEPLMFLKNVISPRPGFHAQQAKKIRLESNANNSSSALIDDIYIEETDVGEDDDHDVVYDDLEEELIATNEGFPNQHPPTNKSSKEEKRTLITLTDSKGSPTKYFTRLQASDPSVKAPANREAKSTSPQSIAEGAVIELNSSSTPAENSRTLEPNSSNNGKKVEQVRDQWTAFGEFVANEMRNYHSDVTRRKLKRKIMQAMLEMDEENDALTALAAVNVN